MLDALTSLTGGGGLTGGSAGPATSGGTASNTLNQHFTGGSVNMGSNNGIPSWVLIAAIAVAALYVLRH